MSIGNFYCKRCKRVQKAIHIDFADLPKDHDWDVEDMAKNPKIRKTCIICGTKLIRIDDKNSKKKMMIPNELCH